MSIAIMEIADQLLSRRPDETLLLRRKYRQLLKAESSLSNISPS